MTTNTLDRLLVVCHLDDMLLGENGALQTAVAPVLRLFTGRGGHFTVLTAMGPQTLQAALGGLPLGAPALCCGGSVLYDSTAQKVLSRYPLDTAAATALLTDACERYPQLGAAVRTDDGVWRVARATPETNRIGQAEARGFFLQQLADIPRPWVEAELIGPPALLDKVQDDMNRRDKESEADVLRTAADRCMLLAKNTAQEGLQALAEAAGVQRREIIFIGRGDGDLPWMQAAGVAVAPSDAPTRAKLTAAWVTRTTSREGAAAEFMYHLVKEDEKQR